jgi:hypothetical protein
MDPARRRVPRLPGLDEWFEKHNRYSSLEAANALSEPRMSPRRALASVLTGSAVDRRRALKAYSYRLPAKSLLLFLYLAILRGGFLDGAAGLNYARLRAVYEGMIAAKVAAMRRKGVRA